MWEVLLSQYWVRIKYFKYRFSKLTAYRRLDHQIYVLTCDRERPRLLEGTTEKETYAIRLIQTNRSRNYYFDGSLYNIFAHRIDKLECHRILWQPTRLIIE